MNDDDFLDEQAPHLDSNLVSQAVVAPSDWTTETLLNQLRRGNIGLNPRFQRRDAWGLARKSQFIESLILGLPIPQIVLAERKEQKGTYLVLDGKQRLLSLMQFSGIADSSKYNQFALQDLDVRDDLNGSRYSDLETDVLLQPTLTAFHNQSIRSVVIRNWPSIAFLHMVFLRLNTGSVTLSSQELRQAAFPGDFSDFVDDAATGSHALRLLLGLDEPDFRMRDVELLARYFSFANFLGEYAGELKSFIDYASERLNGEWPQRSSEIKTQFESFEIALEAGLKIFGRENLARRPTEPGKRRPLNRAILDAILFYFSDATIRGRALERVADVRNAYDELYRGNVEFQKASEASTKTIAATFTRYRLWGEVLRTVLGFHFRLPELADNRIVFNGFW
jgi:hypothetical protein